MIKIRLSRKGSKKRPFYHIVAADSRYPRDGRYLEKLGTFNPMLPKDSKDRVLMNIEAIKAWIAKGAQVTDRVAKFLTNAGQMEAKKIYPQTKQDKPKAKTVERLKEKAAKVAALEEAKKAEIEAAEAAKKQAEEEAKAALAAATETQDTVTEMSAENTANSADEAKAEVAKDEELTAASE